jgi:type II secretory pathway pseudopilin PulG
MAYLELERKLHRVQAQRAQDLQSTTSQLLDIEVKLKQLDPRLDSLEAKAVQSMQYHVDTNNALTAVQSQMSQMMNMMQAMASKKPRQHQQSSYTNAADASVPNPTDTASVYHQQAENRSPTMYPALAMATFPLSHAINSNGSRSVTSTSSGSQHAQPPPKKNLKRTMPDAMEDMTLESQPNDADDSSSSTFGSTPPLFPFQEPSLPPQLHLLPQDVQLLSANSEMENVETSTPNSAIPDLEDKYKPTDNYESSAPTSPDRGTQG